MGLDPLILFQASSGSLWTVCRASQLFSEKRKHILLKVLATYRMTYALIQDEPGMWDYLSRLPNQVPE